MTAAELAPNDEDLVQRADRLCGRFPSIGPERVLQVLRDNGGHAGYAAADLRALSTDALKSADPEDAEHVATLLTNQMLFKQTCKAHFRKFDTNKDGFLEWGEVLALVNKLCNYMGIEHPGEMALRSFFENSDANRDGVLTEREFPKFFESFLRYAFFMQHRRLVGTWRYRADGNEHAEFSISMDKDYRLHYRSVRGGCPGTPKSPALQGRQAVVGTLELCDGWLQADLRVGTKDPERRGSLKDESFYGFVRLRFAEGTTEKVIANFRSDSDAAWGNDVKAKRRQSIEEERLSRCPTPTAGAILRCISENGVAYRRTPEFLDRTDALLAQGDTVRILERHLDTHWIRTSGGWLPTVDPRGAQLFELDSAN